MFNLQRKHRGTKSVNDFQSCDEIIILSRMRLLYLKHSGFDASQFVVSRREGGWSTHFTFDFFGYELTFNKEKSIYFSFENLIFYRPLLLKDIKFEKIKMAGTIKPS